MKKVIFIGALVLVVGMVAYYTSVVDAATNPPLCAQLANCEYIGSVDDLAEMEVWFPAEGPTADQDTMVIRIESDIRQAINDGWPGPTWNNGCNIHPESSLPCRTHPDNIEILMQWEDHLLPGVWHWEVIYNPGENAGLFTGVDRLTAWDGVCFPNWNVDCQQSCLIRDATGIFCDVQLTTCTIDRPNNSWCSGFGVGSFGGNSTQDTNGHFGGDWPFPGWPTGSSGVPSFNFGVGVQGTPGSIIGQPLGPTDTTSNGLVVSPSYTVTP